MIRCYTGLLGGGKSYSMVADAVQWFRKNRGMVYTNMAGLRFPEAVYFSGLNEILHLRSGLVLLDEASVALSSRFWQSVPREVLTRFAQLRKHGLDLWYTAQDEARVDTVMREITNEFVRCRRVMGSRVTRSVDIPGLPERGGLLSFSMPKPLDPIIFDLYDTMEVINTDGSSSGRADMEVALSMVARKRSGTTIDREASFISRPVRLSRINSAGAVVLSEEASKAHEWMRENQRLSTDMPIMPQVAAECSRRRWLGVFGLTIEDVPDDCSLSSPWLHNHDPVTVEERRRERELADLASEVTIKTRGRGAKKEVSLAV